VPDARDPPVHEIRATFYRSLTSDDIELCPMELTIGTPVTTLLGTAFFELEVRTEQTDGRTDGRTGGQDPYICGLLLLGRPRNKQQRIDVKILARCHQPNCLTLPTGEHSAISMVSTFYECVRVSIDRHCR